MRVQNYQALARDFRLDSKKAMAELKESLVKGDRKAEDFSIRKLAEHCIEDGHEFVGLCNPQDAGLTESAMSAVKSTHFKDITGQIVFSKMLEAYNGEEFVFTKLIPTQTTPFSGERIPGITPIGDAATIVPEAGAYPRVGVGQNYIDTPQTLKRGLICPVTKEAIFFDRTGNVLKEASEVGYWLGYNKELRAIDCVVDENTTAHRYNWRGNILATYGDNSGTHTFDNLQASNALVDWTDVNAAELLLAAMLHPDTGTPIMLAADTIIVNPELVHQARYVVNATMVAMQAGGFATTGNLFRTDSANPIGGGPFSANYNIVTSRILPTRMATDTSWFLGKPTKAYVYMENFPLTPAQAPVNSEADFNNDIVVQYKASERGAYATVEPRLMVKSTA